MRAGIPNYTPPLPPPYRPQRRLVKNAAQCNRCKKVIESKHRHDWVQCKCGAIFVDGGLEYMRCGGIPRDFIDLSVWEPLP